MLRALFGCLMSSSTQWFVDYFCCFCVRIHSTSVRMQREEFFGPKNDFFSVSQDVWTRASNTLIILSIEQIKHCNDESIKIVGWRDQCKDKYLEMSWKWVRFESDAAVTN